MQTLYRIYDHTAHEILANAVSSHEQAQEVLHFLRLESPTHEIEIESYTQSSVKPGFGRDPDLH